VIGARSAACSRRSCCAPAAGDVTIYEKTQAISAGRGAGLGLSAELFAVMRRFGAEVSPSTGVSVSSLLWLDRAGQVVRDIKRPWLTGAVVADLPADARGSARRDRQDAHARGGVEQDGARVTALFADGGREEADLLVGADGTYSTVGANSCPGLEQAYAGYGRLARRHQRRAICRPRRMRFSRTASPIASRRAR